MRHNICLDSQRPEVPSQAYRDCVCDMEASSPTHCISAELHLRNHTWNCFWGDPVAMLCFPGQLERAASGFPAEAAWSLLRVSVQHSIGWFCLMHGHSDLVHAPEAGPGIHTVWTNLASSPYWPSDAFISFFMILCVCLQLSQGIHTVWTVLASSAYSPSDAFISFSHDLVRCPS